MKNYFLVLFLLLQIMSCSDEVYSEDGKQLNLDQFKITNNVFEIGLKLMAMPNGLHELELIDSKQKTLVISVHGNNSRGYEWIYPLQVINSETNLITFFRWDDNSCVNPSINILNELIQEKLKENKNIQNVILFGHSYGGLLVASFMEEWIGELP